jgi:hypothetical protein
MAREVHAWLGFVHAWFGYVYVGLGSSPDWLGLVAPNSMHSRLARARVSRVRENEGLGLGFGWGILHTVQDCT